MISKKTIKIGNKEYSEEEIPYLIEKKAAHLFIKFIKFSLLPIVIICFFWFTFNYIVSHGDMDIFHHESLSFTYQNMWNQLLKGKHSVDPDAIQNEAFYLNGNIYTAWSPFPALVRGVYLFFLKDNGTGFPRLSMIIASLLTLLFFSLTYHLCLFREGVTVFQKWFYTLLFTLLIAFGSPLMVLLSCAYIFHEAILWGLAWTSVFVWALINLLYSKKLSAMHLFLLSLSSGGALLSQQFFGFTCSLVFLFLLFVLTLVILVTLFNLKFVNNLLDIIGWRKTFITKSNVLKLLIVSVVPFLICVNFQLTVNHMRWSNAFEFYPYELYKRVNENPEKLRQLKESGVFNILRIPHAIWYYFIPNLSDISNKFPYIELRGRSNFIEKFCRVYYENIENGNSLLIHSPGLIFIAFLGFFSVSYFYGRFGVILLVLFGLPLIWLLAFSSLAQRFSALFVPFLLLCAMPSVKTVLGLENLGVVSRIFTRIFLLFLVLLSIYTTGASMLKLKLDLWSIGQSDKDKVLSFFYRSEELIKKLSLVNFLPEQKYNYVSVVRNDNSRLFPLEPVLGQLWSPDNDKTIFWYDGKNWILIRDDDKKYLGPVSMKIRFNPHTGASETIFQTGTLGSGDSVYVKYLSGEIAQVGFDSWSIGGFSSKSFKVDTNHDYFLEISFGSFYPDTVLGNLSSNVIVKLDGKYLLNDLISFHPFSLGNIRFGKNEISCGPCGGEFTGVIQDIRFVGREIDTFF